LITDGGGRQTGKPARLDFQHHLHEISAAAAHTCWATAGLLMMVLWQMMVGC
jgi:hypothetical protein